MKTKRIIAVMLMAVMLLGIIPFSAGAANWGEGDTLEDALSELKVGFDDKLLDWLVLPNLGVIYQRYAYFKYVNERTGSIDEHPVYCIDPTKGGAYEIVKNIGKNTDGSDTATYIRGEKVGDAKYKAIMTAGYPHMRYEGLGLQSKEEGYYATKLALWMYIRGNNPDKLTINPKYGNSDPVALRVRDAAISIYKNGTTGGTVREPKLTLTGKPSATAILDTNGEYYVQGVEVVASGWIGTNPDACGDVQLSWDSPPPAGTIVHGSDGEDITSTLAVKMTWGVNGYNGKVTIKYPASAVDPETFTPPTLNANAIVPNDGIYVAYAKAGKDKYQRYLVESDPKADLSVSFVSQVNAPPDTLLLDSGLRIRKLQTGTNIPLEGAVFEIRDPDGKLIYSMATDVSGIINLPIAVTGNYTVTEVSPPQYHTLSNNRTQSVYVYYGEVAEVTFTNDPYGTLRVVKRDASNGQPLGGAAVRIRNITTNTTQEMYTDPSGSAVFEKLPIGAYEILEITAPDGYALDTTVHTVNVVPLSEGETSYTLTNMALPGLRITKFDLQTMTPIAGVTFEVWRDGELYGTYVTDAWGEIELRNIPAGTYTAREVATLQGYVLDPTAQWIEIKAGQGYISDLIFFNLAKPGINLVKIDSETFLPLPNARYLIKHVGGSFAKEFTTDINGEISLSELTPGAYTVEEITAPDGYLVDDAIRTIQINAGENAQFVFTNTKKPVLEVLKFDGTRYLPGATFRIAKIEDGSHYLDRVTDGNGRIRIEDLDPGIYSVQEFDPPTGYVLNDYEFHVELFPGRTSQLVVNNVKKPDLCIIKTDANTGLPIEGVTYTVRKVDSATVSTVKTDANGEAWLYALDPGVYQVTEQSVPVGYLLDPNPQLITLFGGRVGVVRFQNDPRPKLRILKVDVVTGEPLKNAEFRVSKVEGLTVSEYITDETGVILIENLDAAIYEVTEFMPPDGYIRYDETKQIQLEPGKTKTLKFDNIRKPTLIVTKTNAMNFEPIPNTVYQIQYEDASGGVHNLGNHRTDANGQIIIKNANPGWYIITEVQAAPGFSLSSNPVTRKYLAPGENAYTNTNISGLSGDVSGNNIVVTSGFDYLSGHEILDYPLNTLVIRKVDANTGELLAGAAFTVRQVSEDISGSSGTLIGRWTTDNSGTIVITGLQPGGYIVEEVQSPPNYLLSENAQQQVWMKSDGTSIIETTFSNWPYGGILITKVDAQTNKPLANARFRVTDSSGAVVGNTNGEYITDENGEILVPDVKPGSYVVTEIEAPEYYTVDTTPQTIKVGVDGGIYKVSFKNQPSGTLVIRKLDTVTKEPLADAVFKVTDSTGAVVGNSNGIFRSDATGTITIPYLSKGSYIVQEIESPDGYILENQSQTIAIDYGKSYTLDFYNKKMSGAQIIKIDSITKQPLKGAKFTVYRMDGGIVGVYETDATGIIILDTLEPGWYKAAETKAPDGYLIDDKPQDFQITANQFVKLVFENAPMSGLLIRKVDTDTRDPLEGAEFTVRAADGTLIGIYRSDVDGTAYIPALSPGWYTVTETAAPTGYTLGDNTQTVQITNSKVVTIEFKNRAFGSIVIKKVDEITGDPLTGAEFSVSKQGGAFVGEYTTGKDGTISIPSVEPSWYVISETKAPTGYTMDNTAKTVEVKPVVPSVVTFTNKPLSGIEIIKLSSVTREPLSGATFTVERDNGERIGTYKTDAAGKIIVPDLTEGTYIVSEITAPDGYIRDEAPRTVTVKSGKLTTVEFSNKPMSGLLIRKVEFGTLKPLAGAEFTIKTMAGVTVGNYRTDAGGTFTVDTLSPGWYVVTETKAPDGYILDNSSQTIEITNSLLITLEFQNKPLASIQIKKIDEVSGIPLVGAAFTVKHQGGALVGEFTTGTDGTINIPGVEPGWYVISETKAPNGYILDSTAKTVEVKATVPTVVTFTNKPLSGIEIIKLDAASKAPLSGATFTVDRDNGERIGQYKTDAAGKIIVSDLTEGTYIVSEITAPDGYILDEAPKTVIVKSGKLTTVEFLNKQKTSLQIKKTDETTGAELRGANFMVQHQNGALVGTYSTDINGLIIIPALEPGWYVVSETKAPDGYHLDSTPKTVEVKTTVPTIVTFTNKPLSGVQVKKIDSVTKRALPGAVFRITDSSGAVVGTSNGEFKTDGNGLINISGLKPGTYIVTEIRCPDGYIMDDTPKTIEVKDGKFYTLEFPNTPIGGFQLLKLDEETRAAIPNVEFTITKMNGEQIGTYTTDANGLIRIPSLTSGWYTAVEKKAATGYKLDTSAHNFEMKDGQTTAITVTNRKASAILIRKIDAVTGKGIYGVKFLISDANSNPLMTVTSDQDGYIYTTGLPDGKYFVREIEAAPGYIIDNETKTFYVLYGSTAEITWKNTPTMGQIQITKKSADDNPVNGFPKGTLLQGAVFEIYDRANNLVDTVTSDKNGLAVSKTLPLGRYTIREVKAPAYYGASQEAINAEIEFTGQIIRLEVLNSSVYTNVSITKRGYTEVVPGQQIRYDFKNIGNNGTVALDSFYWRDTLPTDAVRLNKIVTGTYSHKLNYKIVYKTNVNSNYRTLADNLSTSKIYTIDASAAALGLASNEFVTEFMVVFGRVPAGFKQVDEPYIFCDVLKGLAHEYRFTNKCDVGGLWGNQWIMANDRWVTVVYNQTTPPKLPRTGY